MRISTKVVQRKRERNYTTLFKKSVKTAKIFLSPEEDACKIRNHNYVFQEN